MSEAHVPYKSSSSTNPESVITAEAFAANEKKATEASHIALLKDSVTSIKKSAMRFLSGTALSRVSGMLRDMVLAFSFGTHEAIAALFVAFRLSHVCRRLFGEGALQSAFIPLFEELRKESVDRAFRFFRDLSFLLLFFLTFLVVLTMIGLGIVLSFFDVSPGNRQIMQLMIILMPSLIPICLFGVNSALLQCQKHYFTAGLAPAFFNICITIGAIILHFYSVEANPAMPFIAISIVIGCVMQWFATVPVSLKHIRNVLKEKIFDSIQFLSKDVRLLGGPLALGLLGVGASQINNAVDALFARCADPEGPAQLWYGLRLLQLPLALFGIAISGALLPPLSRAIQAGNKREYLHFLEFALRRVTALLFPCTIALYIFGTHMINFIYGRGDFQAHSVYTTSACLHGYAIGLLPMGFIIVLAPAFYAYKDFRTPTWGAIISLVTNLVLNAFMVFVLEWKAMSVALATSISSWLNILYLYRKLEAHSGRILTEDGAQEFFKVISVSTVAGAITWLIQTRFFAPASLFTFFVNNSEALPVTFVSQAIALALPTCTFITLTLVFAWMVKAHDLLALFRIKKPEIELPTEMQT
jgi:putative peptidoglycan lipid II flippase